MSNEAKSTRVEIDPQKAEKAASPEAAGAITVVNDTSQPALVTLSNGFLGPASQGHIQPGQRLDLPCSPALWDVYVLFEGRTRMSLEFASIFALRIFHDKEKGNVSNGSVLHISDM